ncbi:hypothetical protein BDN71DRAFT_1450417 [Pleurotus eryngii]|uniref:Uncharacterized protein n=1 Tax=Pleurotus eryngii TaxID=5323 RepID=A0A9P6D5C5_PLEER|nr:hypothetical protein BDN71DRAFT_1450417 [Pleurotus eryngii]
MGSVPDGPYVGATGRASPVRTSPEASRLAPPHVYPRLRQSLPSRVNHPIEYIPERDLPLARTSSLFPAVENSRPRKTSTTRRRVLFPRG